MSRGFRVWDNQAKTYDWDREFVLSSDGNLMELCSNHNGTWSYHFANEDRFIVEQDAGLLKDKNGKMIRESDIVSIHDDDMTHDHNKFFGDKSIVRCSLSKGGALVVRNWYGERILGWDIPLRFVEVIGNIHENKKLLGGEE